MNTNEIIGTVDCTPTWEALLQPLLDLYSQNKAIITNAYGTTPKVQKAIDSNKVLEYEFKRMAQAADKWNQSQKNITVSEEAQLQIIESTNSCEGRIENGADINEAFTWFRKEMEQIFEGTEVNDTSLTK